MCEFYLALAFLALLLQIYWIFESFEDGKNWIWVIFLSLVISWDIGCYFKEKKIRDEKSEATTETVVAEKNNNVITVTIDNKQGASKDTLYITFK